MDEVGKDRVVLWRVASLFLPQTSRPSSVGTYYLPQLPRLYLLVPAAAAPSEARRIFNEARAG